MTRQWCSHLSGRARLLSMKLRREGKTGRRRLGAGRGGAGGGGRFWGRERKAGLTFRRAAKAGPKVALTCTRSRIQAGSFARIGGRAYRWSRSTMLAKSF